MTPQRYKELETDESLSLTEEEFAAGWHWCPDWGDMLVGPNTLEMECCTCHSKQFAKKQNNDFTDGNGY